MLHICVRKFDVTITVANFLPTERGLHESSHVEGHLSSAELTTSAAQNVNLIKIQDIKKKKNVCFLPSQQHLSL